MAKMFRFFIELCLDALTGLCHRKTSAAGFLELDRKPAPHIRHGRNDFICRNGASNPIHDHFHRNQSVDGMERIPLHAGDFDKSADRVTDQISEGSMILFFSL